MKCFLKVLNGVHQGKLIPITAQRFLVESTDISERHCEFIQKNDRMYLVDLTSRTGTYLNGLLLPAKEMTSLRNGDKVSIANLEFECLIDGEADALHEEDSGDIDIDSWLNSPDQFERNDDAQALLEDGSVNDMDESCTPIEEDDENENLLAVQHDRGMDSTWDQNVSVILQMIRKSHVYYPGTDADNAILGSGTSTGAALRGLFDFVGVFDCRMGSKASKPFELGSFLQFHVRDLLSSLLGLTLGPEYNQEQIPQMLEDFGEKKCLWCFLHSELLSANDLQHLREFTQSRHRVLFCGPNQVLAQKCEGKPKRPERRAPIELPKQSAPLAKKDTIDAASETLRKYFGRG
jgi:hypothetical protein